MLNKIMYILLICLIVSNYYASGQETIEISAAKDAMLRSVNGIGDNTNRGSYLYNIWHAGTSNQSNDIVTRSLIDFDFRQIPNGVIVTKAELYLYSDLNNNGQWSGGHTYSPLSNSSTARRIISPWTEHSVTWNNQPTTTLQNEVIVPVSTSSHQHYVLDVTSLVQDILLDTANSFGLQFKLNIETSYRKMVFASRNNATSTYHPKLIVEYMPMTTSTSSDEKFQNKIKIFPNPSAGLFEINTKNLKLSDLRFELLDLRGLKMNVGSPVHLSQSFSIGEDLIPGIYFLKISSSTESVVFRLVKTL
ncbi:MAG: T9SS type A sorting domain-containing protein [Bacteroidia bacterium]|nr:T9SS type A sorting domain-containing protein [Bacteroidia bacterium]